MEARAGVSRKYTLAFFLIADISQSKPSSHSFQDHSLLFSGAGPEFYIYIFRVTLTSARSVKQTTKWPFGCFGAGCIFTKCEFMARHNYLD